MNAAEIKSAGAKLDASGVRLYRRERDRSGNTFHMEPLPWEQALVRILAEIGWTIVEEDAPENAPPAERPALQLHKD